MTNMLRFSSLRPARALAAGALLAMALSGCARYEWFKPGATQSDYSQAVYACNMEAAHAYPPLLAMQQVAPGYFAPGYMRCGPYGCWSGPGYFVPPAMGAVDVNQGNRDQAANQCMQARGWQLVKVK
ncbi:MAG TPA: hypothetical protein VF445_09335 [Bordetella sp.]|uniref:hypothetical protein n=1 Tax=Bordetella sp. TaxID=28081 RepID=UPI002ED0EC91